MFAFPHFLSCAFNKFHKEAFFRQAEGSNYERHKDKGILHRRKIRRGENRVSIGEINFVALF